MAKNKYEYHPELKMFRNMHLPISAPLLPSIQKMLGVFYKLQTDDEELKVEKIHITSRDGYRIPTMIYTPKVCSPGRPCIVFYHGGAFIYNAAPHHFELARRLAKQLNVKLFLVDYRLAPEHIFPVAPEDCFDAYKWIVKNSDELQINKEKIVLCGDSAGGNLSAVVSIKAREEKIQKPCCQVLLYPLVDRSLKSESMLTYNDTPMWNCEMEKKLNKIYFPFDSHEKIHYFSPVEAEELSNLPPTYIETAEFDCLRDGGILYEKLLRESGVETQLKETKGTMHGYDIALTSKLMKSIMKERTDFMKKYMF